MRFCTAPARCRTRHVTVTVPLAEKLFGPSSLISCHCSVTAPLARTRSCGSNQPAGPRRVFSHCHRSRNYAAALFSVSWRDDRGGDEDGRAATHRCLETSCGGDATASEKRPHCGGKCSRPRRKCTLRLTVKSHCRGKCSRPTRKRTLKLTVNMYNTVRCTLPSRARTLYGTVGRNTAGAKLTAARPPRRRLRRQQSTKRGAPLAKTGGRRPAPTFSRLSISGSGISSRGKVARGGGGRSRFSRAIGGFSDVFSSPFMPSCFRGSARLSLVRQIVSSLLTENFNVTEAGGRAGWLSSRP
jgi:hypothetical protein